MTPPSLQMTLVNLPDSCCLLSNILSQISVWGVTPPFLLNPIMDPIMERPSLLILTHHLHSCQQNGFKPISSYTLDSETAFFHLSKMRLHIHETFDTFTQIFWIFWIYWIFWIFWDLSIPLPVTAKKGSCFSLELLTSLPYLYLGFLFSRCLFFTLHIQKSNTFTLICSTSSYTTILTPSTPFTHHL